MPNAILLMTGSELTRGETKDTNGPFVATELSVIGVPVDAISLVPDDPALLEKAAREAIERADVVVMSGGLGPTADDHTVAVLSRVFRRAVVRHPQAVERMRARALARGWTDDKIPVNFFKQAEVLEGVDVLLNPVGLAPGMAIPTSRGLLFVLPGVPRELQGMLRSLVVPRIESRFTLSPPRILRAKVLGLGESWAEAKIQEAGIDFGRVEYGISAKPGELLVKFLAHLPEHHAYLDEVLERLGKAFGPDLVALPEGLVDASGSALNVEHSRIVHDLLLESGRTLATAESCTGGAIAKALTDHAGSSSYFLGSVVAYENGVKEKLLGVPRALLERHGAVSREVCEAMARGAAERFGADIAVSTTGIAGPGGGTPEKPVGLVYIGTASGNGGAEAEEHRFVGNREAVRQAATVRALEMVRRRLPTRSSLDLPSGAP